MSETYFHKEGYLIAFDKIDEDYNILESDTLLIKMPNGTICACLSSGNKHIDDWIIFAAQKLNRIPSEIYVDDTTYGLRIGAVKHSPIELPNGLKIYAVASLNKLFRFS